MVTIEELFEIIKSASADNIDEGIKRVQEFLTKRDLDINGENEAGLPPLMAAMSRAVYEYNEACWRIVELFLDVQGIDVNVDVDGITALGLASMRGKVKIVEKLLGHRDIKVNDGINNQSPLHLAIHDGHKEVVEKLLGHRNINVDEALWKTAKDKGNNEIISMVGAKLLFSAIHNIDLDKIKDLLEIKGVDVNCEYRVTPLGYAAREHDINLDIINLLLEKGANVNCVTNTFPPVHPMIMAAMNNRFDVVKVLLKVDGVLVNVVHPYYQYTTLHYAAKHEEMEVAKLLLDKGANINAKDRYGETSLYYAARYKKWKMEKYLKNNGANGDIPSGIGKDGITGSIIGGIAGLAIGVALAYLAGAAALTPLYLAVATFIGAAVIGVLIGGLIGSKLEDISMSKVVGNHTAH